jgi:predicted small secreted protein
MKKTNLIKSILMVACCVFFMAGCQNNAVADDGTDIRDYSKIDTDSDDSGSGGGGAGGAGWALCKNSGYDIFEIQVWGDGAGTFDFANKDGYSTFTITEKGGGWVGGGLIANDTSKTFDFSKVAKMTFEIRGTISNKALCIGVQNNGGASAKIYPSKTNLTKEIKQDEWTKIEFNVAGAKSDTIINAFMIIAAADWGGSFDKNDYFDIRNLDYLDSSGNTVTLTLK